MFSRIYQDEQEFRNILRGIFRRDLVKFIQREQVLLPTAPDAGVIITIDEIEIPHLRFETAQEALEQSQDGKESESLDPNGDIGVGQGPGQPGTDLGPVSDKNGEGASERSAGRGRGKGGIKITISQEDFYRIFQEVFQLPRIKPKGEKAIKVSSNKYTGISRIGPESLRHTKRTLKQALKRTMAEGLPDLKNPNAIPAIIPLPDDKRYRAPKPVIKRKNNAVIFYLMDVSGSVTQEDREVVRYFCQLSEFWIRCNYDGMEMVWIIHDDGADRVSREEFFGTQRSGGTVISSALELMLEIIQKEYPPASWNIYPMYFSDGFNWGTDDTICQTMIRDRILPIVNQFTYGEVAASRYWWDYYQSSESRADRHKRFSPQGNFGKMIVSAFGDNELVAATNLTSMDRVPDAIREVFKRGN